MDCKLPKTNDLISPLFLKVTIDKSRKPEKYVYIPEKQPVVPDEAFAKSYGIQSECDSLFIYTDLTSYESHEGGWWWKGNTTDVEDYILMEYVPSDGTYIRQTTFETLQKDLPEVFGYYDVLLAYGTPTGTTSCQCGDTHMTKELFEKIWPQRVESLKEVLSLPHPWIRGGGPCEPGFAEEMQKRFEKECQEYEYSQSKQETERASRWMSSFGTV